MPHLLTRLSLVALLAGTTLAAAALDLQGHRGARGHAPENTLPAFERALALGVDTLELDVGLTADGVVVVAHDRALNPAITRDASGQWLTPGKGPLLHTLTLAQLQTYDVGRIRPDTPYARALDTQQPRDGTRIPTLAAVFERVKVLGAPVRFNIETKIDPREPQDTATPQALTEALLAVVHAQGMASRVSIQSFDWRTLRLVQQREPAIATVYLTQQGGSNDTVRDGRWTDGRQLADHGSVPRMVKAAGGAAWSPNAAALTQALVEEAHALGLKVIPWTVNPPADMDRLIEWGVDGLITDYPDRAREVMRARGLPLPVPVRVAP